MAMVDCVVVGSFLVVSAIPLLTPCKDVMDRTINANNRALIIERHCAESRHE